MVLVLSVGALECLVGHPLDTVRVRIISRAGAGAAGRWGLPLTGGCITHSISISISITHILSHSFTNLQVWPN